MQESGGENCKLAGFFIKIDKIIDGKQGDFRLTKRRIWGIIFKNQTKIMQK